MQVEFDGKGAREKKKKKKSASDSVTKCYRAAVAWKFREPA